MIAFAELLREYIVRTGISDAELARAIGVRRQTIFRWKEGLVTRPRSADEVRRCAAKLRLTPAERDALLMAAGFPPDEPPVHPRARIDVPPADPAMTVEPESAQPAQVARRDWKRALPFIFAVLLIAALLGGSTYVVSRSSYPSARSDETLIVIGQFTNYTGGASGYNVAGRLQEALQRELNAGRLSDIRVETWPRSITDEENARDVAARSGAALVIWGEYDSGRALARFTAHTGSSDGNGPDVEKRVTSPADLAATINSTLPEEVRSAALFAIGQLLVDRGNLTQARALLGQAAARPPADPAALAGIYHLLAYSYDKDPDSDPQMAADYYTRAIELNPTLISAYNNRGTNYLKMGGEANVRRAIADFDWVIAQMPELVESRFNRGLAYIRLDRPEEWKRDLGVVLAAQPDHIGAQNAFCWAYALSEQPETALPYCDRAAQLDPEGPARDSRGIVYSRLSRFPEALAEFQAYLSALERDQPERFQSEEARYRDWLSALEDDRDPFDAALLSQLRREPGR